MTERPGRRRFAPRVAATRDPVREAAAERVAAGAPAQGRVSPERAPAALGLGPGQPLPGSERGYFEQRLGVDLSSVRVHPDSPVAEEYGARGLAAGRDIAIAPGHWQLGSPAFRRLIGHELAHTQQQAQTGPAVQLDDTLPAGAFDVATLDQSYNTAVRAARQTGDWQNAAELLNGFNREDILQRLTFLTRQEVGFIHQGAVDNPRVGPDSQLARLTVVAPVASTPETAATTPLPQSPLGTAVIADVVSQKQQGVDSATARASAFQKLKLALDTSFGPLSPEARQGAVTTIAAAMAGLKFVEPSMLSEGKAAHLLIGEFYRQFNPATLLDPSLIVVLRALKLSASAYAMLYNRLPEELLEVLTVRPDIVDLGKMQVYEIKSVNSGARAVPEMLEYIELLESFKIPGVDPSVFVFHPGSPTNAGTRGILPGATVGRGWIIFCSPLPGAIIYRTLNQPENPRHALERLESELRGTSDMMVGVESVTAVSVVLAEGFEQLIPLLIDAVKLAGQAIPDIAKNLVPAPALAR